MTTTTAIISGATRHSRRPLRRVDIAVIGATGRIGRRVLALLAERGDATIAAGIRLHLSFVCNSRQAIADDSGLAPISAAALLAGSAFTPTAGLLDGIAREDAHPLIVLDCSASADVAAYYPQWLAAGIDVVTPNKHGPSADRQLASAITAAQAVHGARIWDATTVGAQLPLLAALRELHRAGDRIERVEAVLSGTLSYVLAHVQHGAALSTAVRDAVVNGFAEPHPARDLSGEDAARKLVILLRALGRDIELAEVECAPLVDTALLEEPDPAILLRNLGAADEIWRARAALAQVRQHCWIYRASFENGRARVAPECVPLDHALARLAPCENALLLHSAFYAAAPLRISGPGAGVDLTAAGVFGDLLNAAQRYAAPAVLPSHFAPVVDCVEAAA